MCPKRSTSIFAAILASVIVFISCRKEPSVVTHRDSAEIPVLDERTDPFPVSPNIYLATLGRVLFYDKELSLNKNISCGSCHKQENAFTDNLQFSPGTNNLHTKRNTPSIFAKNGRLFWDGRSFSMSDLALRPVRDEVEMDHDDIDALIGRISRLDYYKPLFSRAFPNRSRVDSNMIKDALAEFLRNFAFADNKFHRSQKGIDKLNPSEEMGRNLFFGKAKCSLCHHIVPDFSNNGYGVTDESHNIGLDIVNKDRGVGAITGLPQDEGAFMMPVLLNVELTAPYMHDGRFKTLEEVVEHYNSEIKNNPNLDHLLRTYDYNTGTHIPLKLNLTGQEKKALVDFLKTLTDPSVLTDKRFSNPFVTRES